MGMGMGTGMGIGMGGADTVTAVGRLAGASKTRAARAWSRREVLVVLVGSLREGQL